MLNTSAPAGRNVLSVLGAKFVVVPPGFPATQVAHLSRVYTGPDATIYENEAAVPAVMVPASVSIAPDETPLLGRLAGPLYRPTDALVEARTTTLNIAAGRGAARVVRRTDTSVDMRVDLQRGGLVVLNETYAPGWAVTVDGHPEPALRVNGVMRGVVVPMGSHVVGWHYRAPGLIAGLLLSVCALVATLAIGAIGRRRQRRSPDDSPIVA